MKRLILFLFLVLSTNVLAEEKKITADELKDTIANMPINRFAFHLRSSGQFNLYQDLLYEKYNPSF